MAALTLAEVYPDLCRYMGGWLADNPGGPIPTQWAELVGVYETATVTGGAMADAARIAELMVQVAALTLEREEWKVQSHGAATRANNAERREATPRARVAALEAELERHKGRVVTIRTRAEVADARVAALEEAAVFTNGATTRCHLCDTGVRNSDPAPAHHRDSCPLDGDVRNPLPSTVVRP